MAKSFTDKNTGEIIREPDFVKLYISDMCRVKGLNSGQVKIFNFMLANMNWENVVSYGPNTKASFLNENEMKNQTFNNNVSKLISSMLIERIGRGEFRINKKYAVKVDWSKVQEIKWETTYGKDGKREIVTMEAK